jgi:Ca2+-binding RTX toxin-like protein
MLGAATGSPPDGGTGNATPPGHNRDDILIGNGGTDVLDGGTGNHVIIS